MSDLNINKITYIRPQTGWLQFPDLAELWHYRDLFWIFVIRDIRVRYKQTVLGAMWAIIQPVATMIVLSIFFGNLLGVADKVSETMGHDIPYPIFLYAGLLPWLLFSNSVGQSARSLISEAAIIRKIYMPRQIIPIAAIGAPVLDFLVALVVLVLMMFWYDLSFNVGLVLFPLLILSIVVAALGVGFLLSALGVAYRDFRYIVPFMLQLWMYLTPVIYPINIVPESYRWILILNPVGGTIEAIKAVILGLPVDYMSWSISMAVSVVFVVVGLFYFNAVERRFADIA